MVPRPVPTPMSIFAPVSRPELLEDSEEGLVCAGRLEAPAAVADGDVVAAAVQVLSYRSASDETYPAGNDERSCSWNPTTIGSAARNPAVAVEMLENVLVE